MVNTVELALLLSSAMTRDLTEELVVNEKQAVIVRRISDDFLSGLTPCPIAKRLTEEGIETPGTQKVWHQSTVYSILKNEKYYVGCNFTRKITLDFLNKKQVKNTGQLPRTISQMIRSLSSRLKSSK